MSWFHEVFHLDDLISEEEAAQLAAKSREAAMKTTGLLAAVIPSHAATEPAPAIPSTHRPLGILTTAIARLFKK